MTEGLIKQWRTFLQEIAPNSGLADRWDFAFRYKVSFFAPYLPGGLRVLDIGCGEGVLSFFLGYLGHQVFAIDRSARQIALNEVNAVKMGLKSVSFKAIDIEDLDPCLGGRYDVILCTDVLEHLDEPESVILKIVQFLNEGGSLFLSLPSPSAPIHRVRMRLFGYDRFDFTVSHRRRFTVAETREIVNGAGLALVEVREVEGLLKNWFYVTRIGRYMQRFNRWTLKDFFLIMDQVTLKLCGGAGHYAVARKSRGQGNETDVASKGGKGSPRQVNP